ncbi:MULTISPECIES: hypothetical protein [Staphylococcus]|uniref:hypothetical protein n=1 Tax=Staphylococcus TaxID=1279 RepID=UPI001071CBCC|nr:MULTISPECIES: hypothetical protein [Staphylococcus]MBF0770047.1 hypothetical protein [Staphylococcus warneri]MCI2748815.1 hypothetical protein [Staphylococcus warneri]MCI2768081.1 hypothetical protein [Staphylococcus warneri]MCI2777168.1 hypothetical protein [Staphylococcus warneri]MCI2787779.1 hypothetical protein [Staphylococcus warneri]
MTKKKWFVFILITILLIVFYYIVAILKGIEYKDKITICISFTGLFATFGGAYLGAKVSGDNSRKLYEYQKNEKNKQVINKLEIIANIKMIKVLNHSNIAKESRLKLYIAPEDNRTYDEIMSSGIMETLDLIDGYANPIIELLEDREIYEGSPNLYRSLLKMFNECNRMNYHINQIDIKDKSGRLPEDFNNLSEDERDYLQDTVHEYRGDVRKDILINFVEFEFIETILNDCASEILNSISEENKLVESIDFKNHIDMRYTLNLK